MKYHPIPDFRILDLQPGVNGDPISCTLRLAPLGDNQYYEAVSYTWEDQKPTELIVCNGENTRVTKNVRAALEHMRREDRIRSLWVDQVCINQMDANERTKQVRLMGKIYSEASCVVVWLGQDDHETPMVWHLFQRFKELVQYDLLSEYERVQLHQLGSDTVPETPSDSHRPPRHLIDAVKDLHTDDSQWEAVSRFYSKKWFSRTWVFQEAVLARDCRIQCGQFEMSWLDFTEANKAIDRCGFGHRIPDVFMLNLISTLRSLLRRNAGLRISYLLSVIRTLCVKEPHDKIYALLGLMSSRYNLSIDPDYSSPLHELYGAIVKTSIIEEQCLTMLSEVEVRRTTYTSMPSWVPDWRFKQSTKVSLGFRNPDNFRYFKATLDIKPVLTQITNARKLILRGFLFLPISNPIDVESYLDLDSLDRNQQMSLTSDRWAVQTWYEMYRRTFTTLGLAAVCVRTLGPVDKFIGSLGESEKYDRPTQDNMLMTAFRETLLAGLSPQPPCRYPRHEQEYHWPAYSAWQHQNFQPSVPPQVLREHDNQVCKTMFNRRFFLAGSGNNTHMGIALGTFREGDWICLLLGGDTPFILRPSKPATVQHADEVEDWEFIAECYVHGVMDGEAMEMTKGPGFKYKDFVMEGYY